jgi:hypothetical protein
MPRQKIKVYQYDKQGKYLRTYDSMREVTMKYFNNPHYPLFENKIHIGGEIKKRIYDILPDDTYVVKKRIGRDKLLMEVKIDNDIYCKTYKADKPVEVFNLLGQKVAEFANIRVAESLTNIDRSTLDSRLKSVNKKVNKLNSDHLEYRYKS